MTSTGRGSPLVELRHAAGLTQEELAERAQVTVRAISNLENGRTDRPRKSTLAAIAAAVGLDASQADEFVRAFRVPPARPLEVAVDRDAQTLAFLPPPAQGFVGRQTELALVRGALTSDVTAAPTLITGLGGIGKSALAIEACAAEAWRFPGGVLYAKLCRPDGSRTDPGDLLATMLGWLGIDVYSIPTSTEGRAALWRSAVARRPVLVLLDDAVDEPQVRVLLTGSGRFVVTSRSALGGLDTAVRVRLGPLDDESGAAVLRHAPPWVIGADDRGLARLVRTCSGVPLALRLVAARIAMNPHTPLAVLADALDMDGRPLDGLVSGDRSVRASISGSFETLAPAGRRALHNLALLGLPHFGTWQVACAAGVPLTEATRLAEEIAASGLFEYASSPAAAGRFTLHDLVVAAVAGRTEEPVADTRTHSDVVHRLCAWAVHLLCASADSGVRRPVKHSLWPERPDELSDAVIASVLRSPGPWILAEWSSLAALIDAALNVGEPDLAGAVLAALRQHMIRMGRLHELRALAARCVAASSGHRLARGCALATLATVDAELGYEDAASAALTEALPDLVDVDGCTLGWAYYEQAWLCERRGDVAAADHHYHRALDLHRSMGNTYGEIACRSGLAEMHHTHAHSEQATEHALAAQELAAHIHDHRTTIRVSLMTSRVLARTSPASSMPALRAALRLANAHDDATLRIPCLLAIAETQRTAGALASASACARKAVELAQALERPADAARALTEQGKVHLARGRQRQATAAWGAALEITSGLGHSAEAECLTELLSGL